MAYGKIFPAAMGAGVLQINLLVDTILASLAGSSAVSYLYYSDNCTTPSGNYWCCPRYCSVTKFIKTRNRKKRYTCKTSLRKKALY